MAVLPVSHLIQGLTDCVTGRPCSYMKSVGVWLADLLVELGTLLVGSTVFVCMEGAGASHCLVVQVDDQSI